MKPRKYAQAGIPCYWRAEENGGLPVVCVYEIDPVTRAYCLTGVFHNRLTLTVPFLNDIDLTADRRR
ncbi:hypothetical protein GCM10010279_37690 [Streptomyces mutabilis]|nr:hypothetical protein GCM10010279_37690 [Streptomyces mutabilis]